MDDNERCVAMEPYLLIFRKSIKSHKFQFKLILSIESRKTFCFIEKMIMILSTESRCKTFCFIGKKIIILNLVDVFMLFTFSANFFFHQNTI